MVLIINGSLDVFQSPELNFHQILHMLSEAKNKDVTLMIAPNINHVLQEAESGLPTDYGKNENTVAPIILDSVLNWIKTRFIN